MIADNAPVGWENAMNNWCKGLRLKKGQGYALVISDDGQHHWIPGRHVKVRKEEEMFRHLFSRRAASDGDNKTDNQQLLPTGSKDQQSQTAYLGSIEETDHWKGRIGQRAGTAFDLGYLGLGYAICGSYRGRCQSYFLGIRAGSSPTKTKYAGGCFCSNFHKWALLGHPSLPVKPEKEGQQLSNVSVGTDLTPICMGAETHRLKTGLQSWLSLVKEPQVNKIHFFSY